MRIAERSVSVSDAKQGVREIPFVPIAIVAVVSLALTLWYCSYEFTPNIGTGGQITGYDAFQYHFFAQLNSRQALPEILAGSTTAPFEQKGYPVLLSLVYSLTSPDPIVGSIFNWLLWLAAGLLLVPLAKAESDTSTPLPFLTLWLLYPEAIDWNGTTSKETLSALAVAIGLRVCSSRWPRWMQILVVGAIAGFMLSVRNVIVPIILVALAISLTFRGEVSRIKWSRPLVLAVASVLALYVIGSTLGEAEIDNPLMYAGFSKTEESFSAGLSNASILRRLGSSDRLVDCLYIPVRGIAHLISPLYVNPISLPFAKFLQLSWILWFSAAVCSASALAIILCIWDRQPWTPKRAILFGALSLGLITLGLSGIIHERYRSIIVAALLPFGLRSIRQEMKAHGSRRLLVGGVILPVFVFLFYRILRQLS